MRATRKLALLAVMALAALAMTASSASAFSVAPEAGGSCSAITPPVSHSAGTGGCVIKATSNAPVELGTALGMVTCTNDFEGKVTNTTTGTHVEGYIYGETLTGCSPVTVTPCAASEAGKFKNWPAELTSETNMEAQFCVTAFGITINCHLATIGVMQNATHIASFTTGASHEFCEGSASNSVQGNWTSVTDAAHPAVEIKDMP